MSRRLARELQSQKERSGRPRAERRTWEVAAKSALDFKYRAEAQEAGGAMLADAKGTS